MRGATTGTYIVYGDRRIGFGEFVAQRQPVSAGAGHGDWRRPRRPGRGALGQQPRVVPHVLGDGRPGRHPRRPQRLVEGRRDRLRPRGLRRQGARRRPQALRADRRPARRVPRPRGACSSSTPTRPTSSRPTTGCTASTSSTADGEAPTPRRPDRRGRPRRHLLHERHHRPAQGRHLDPPRDDRQPAEHDVQRRRRRHGRRRAAAAEPTPDAPPAARPSSLLTSPLFHVSGCHSALVVGTAGRHEARDPRGQVRAREGHAADPGRAGHRVGDRAHDGVAGVRAPDPPRLRHVVGHDGGLRRLAVGRRAAAHGARRRSRTCGRRSQRLRPHRVVLGRHRPSAARTSCASPTRSGRPMPVVEITHRRRRRRRGPDRPAGRGLDHGARSSCPATGTSPRPPPRR